MRSTPICRSMRRRWRTNFGRRECGCDAASCRRATRHQRCSRVSRGCIRLSSETSRRSHPHEYPQTRSSTPWFPSPVHSGGADQFVALTGWDSGEARS